MTEQASDGPAAPVVRSRKGPSVVWLIPVLALVIGGWLIVHTLLSQGPELTITFRTAAGVEAGKTRIKYKSVDVGVVERVQLSEDFDRVRVQARLEPGMEHLLRRNSRFWVVRPQLGLRGVSGLETLVSGAYIQVDPGTGAPQRHFQGLERQPLVTADEPGRTVTLVSEHLGGIDVGSPIYYRGLLAGEVLGHELAGDRHNIYISAFVRDPFDQLLRADTRFWNVSGLEAGLGADGPQLRLESMRSLLFGGIAFETPDTYRAGAEADVESLLFTLHENRDAIEERAYIRKLDYVAYFDSSVRGLNVGAPVEFRGIRVGAVRDIRLQLDPETVDYRIPVRLEIEPERMLDSATLEEHAPEAILQRLVDEGLRARLQTSSLLTGQLFVELDMHPDTEMVMRGGEGVPYTELPTIPGAVETITRTMENLVSQLDQVAIDEIADNLLATLEGTNAIANAPELRQLLTDLSASATTLDAVLEQVHESDPGVTLKHAQGALREMEATLAATHRALEPHGELQHRVSSLLDQLEASARAVRELVELLQQQPEAVIFGRQGERQ